MELLLLLFLPRQTKTEPTDYSGDLPLVGEFDLAVVFVERQRKDDRRRRYHGRFYYYLFWQNLVAFQSQ